MSATRRCTRIGVATAALALLTASGQVRARTRACGRLDWPRFGWDAARSNAFSGPTCIPPGKLSRLSRREIPLPGIADSSAIFLSSVPTRSGGRDLAFLTTAYGKTIAVDVNSGSIIWTFTPPRYAALVRTSTITTSSPVASADRRWIFAASPDGYVQKLSARDGTVAWRTRVTLSPGTEKISSALNFYRGRVVAVTSGYPGDAPPYVGHVVVVDAANGRVEGIWNSLCAARHRLLAPGACDAGHSGIWGRGGAVIDPRGNIFVATGNGLRRGTNYWGDSVVELSPRVNRILGSYTPPNAAELEDRDLDLGSSSPALLPGGLVLQGGKDGMLRLIRLSSRAGRSAGLVQAVPTPSGNEMYTTPAVARTMTGTFVFAADNHATEAWALRGGRLRSLWRNHNGGTSPILAGGLLYVYDPRGELRVYTPATGVLLAVLPCGAGHWNSPIVIDAHIILPEGSANAHSDLGILDIWSAGSAPVTAH